LKKGQQQKLQIHNQSTWLQSNQLLHNDS